MNSVITALIVMILGGGAKVRCQPRPGIPLKTIRHLLVDQVMPLVLSQRGGVFTMPIQAHGQGL